VLPQPPTVKLSYDEARVKGGANAPVTIVESADFQCPYCKKSEATLNALLSKYAGRVKLAFLDFPLTEIHSQAEEAAEAARCAGEQAKFESITITFSATPRSWMKPVWLLARRIFTWTKQRFAPVS